MHRWVVAIWVNSKVEELLVPKVVVVVEEDEDEDEEAVETKGMHRYRR